MGFGAVHFPREVFGADMLGRSCVAMSYGQPIDGVVDRQMLDRQWQVRAANGRMPTDPTDTGAQRCVSNGPIERLPTRHSVADSLERTPNLG